MHHSSRCGSSAPSSNTASAQQRPCVQIQTLLQLRCRLCRAPRGTLGRRQRTQVRSAATAPPRSAHACCCHAAASAHTSAAAAHRAAQQPLAQARRQQRHARRRRHCQQHRLIEVMRLLQVAARRTTAESASAALRPVDQPLLDCAASRAPCRHRRQLRDRLVLEQVLGREAQPGLASRAR